MKGYISPHTALGEICAASVGSPFLEVPTQVNQARLHCIALAEFGVVNILRHGENSIQFRATPLYTMNLIRQFVGIKNVSMTNTYAIQYLNSS